MRPSLARGTLITALVTAGALTAAPVAAHATSTSAPKPDRNAVVRPLHAPCGSRPNLPVESTTRTIDDYANLRSGSSTGCAALGQAQRSHVLEILCYTRGNDGYFWDYVRNRNTGVRGWIREDLIYGYGTVYCYS